MPDVLDLFSDVFRESASKAAGTFLQEVTKEQLKSLSYSAIFVAVSGEVAKAAGEAIVGPMLKAFLRVLDPTQKKLDTMLREPLRTAVSFSRQGLSMKVVNENDIRIRDQHFSAALQSFEKAYSYASERKEQESTRIYIRLAQATIVKSMNAPGWVDVYLQEFVSTLKEQFQLAEERARAAAQRLEEAKHRQTPEGAHIAAQQRDEMLADLGPQPLEGFRSASPLGMELGVDNKSWRHARKGIIDGAKAPSQIQLAELERELNLADEKLNRLKAFGKFWAVSFT